MTQRPKWFSKHVALASVLVASLFSGVPDGKCSEVTYNVNLNFNDIIFGSEHISGTITTNGKTGILTPTDFIAWDITATGSTGLVTIKSPTNNGLASCYLSYPCGVYATPTTISANNAFAVQNIVSTGLYLTDYSTSSYLTPASFSLIIGGIYGDENIGIVTANQYGLGTGKQFLLLNPTIATANVVPIPTAALLFGSALAGLSIFGKRRKSV